MIQYFYKKINFTVFKTLQKIQKTGINERVEYIKRGKKYEGIRI